MSPDSFNTLTIVVGVLSLIGNAALIFWFGPLRAARYTREAQRDAADKDRKKDVFRRLAATRGARLNPDHVWALNLIPVEFSDIPTVMTAWRAYLEHLNFKVPQDEAAKEAFFHEQDNRLMALIQAIATDVGIAFDRWDIQKFSYIPQGWGDDEFDQKMIRKLALSVLRGLSPIRVAPMPTPEGGPFPPPPTAETPKIPRPSSP